MLHVICGIPVRRFEMVRGHVDSALQRWWQWHCALTLVMTCTRVVSCYEGCCIMGRISWGVLCRSLFLVCIYFMSFGTGMKPMLTAHDGRHQFGLSAIWTCDHLHASPELYHCTADAGNVLILFNVWMNEWMSSFGPQFWSIRLYWPGDNVDK